MNSFVHWTFWHLIWWAWNENLVIILGNYQNIFYYLANASCTLIILAIVVKPMLFFFSDSSGMINAHIWGTWCCFRVKSSDHSLYLSLHSEHLKLIFHDDHLQALYAFPSGIFSIVTGNVPFGSTLWQCRWNWSLFWSTTTTFKPGKKRYLR